jgi:Uma2 family endonuclease
MRAVKIRTRRLTRIEYDRLVERAVLDEEDPIELLDGRLVFRGETRGSLRAAASIRIRLALNHAFGPSCHVRGHFPIGPADPPEHWPDVVVLRGRYQDYVDAYPSPPLLVVEIADSTLTKDRRKGARYAHAKIADYWIVNLGDRVLEIQREPARSAGRWRYCSVRVLRARAVVSPLAVPRARIRVADLLP